MSEHGVPFEAPEEPTGVAQTWAQWRGDVNDQLRDVGKSLSQIKGGLLILGVLLAVVGTILGGYVENICHKASAAEVQQHEGRFHK